MINLSSFSSSALSVSLRFYNYYDLQQITDGALRHFQYGNLEFNIIRAVTHPTRIVIANEVKQSQHFGIASLR